MTWVLPVERMNYFITEDRSKTRQNISPGNRLSVRRSYVPRRADVYQDADCMICLFRLTDLSAVKYQKVRQISPFLFRRDRDQVLFDLHRVVVLRQAEAIGKPLTVRV